MLPWSAITGAGTIFSLRCGDTITHCTSPARVSLYLSASSGCRLTRELRLSRPEQRAFTTDLSSYLATTVLISHRALATRVRDAWRSSLVRFSIVAILPSLILTGCYWFVGDDVPPEWEGDGAAAQQGALPTTAGGPGAAVYNAKCAVCHQMNGQGIPGVYPTLAGSAYATGDPVKPIMIVLHGFQGPIVRNGRNYNGVMQPWQNELTDQQIADVLTYIRSSWGNSAAAVDAAAVTAVREKTKGKIGAYTEAELEAAI